MTRAPRMMPAPTSIQALLPKHWMASGGCIHLLRPMHLCVSPSMPDLRSAADATHALFLLLCPQRPEHSYFLFGHKLAMEQRMLAMFGAQLIGGLAFGALRGRVSSGLDWRLFTLASVPVAWDILSQSFGLRVS